MKQSHLALLVALSLCALEANAAGWGSFNTPPMAGKGIFPPGDDEGVMPALAGQAPGNPNLDIAPDSDSVLLEKTKGIVLLGNPDLVVKEGITGVAGIKAEDISIPGGLEGLQKQLAPLFIDKPLTQFSLLRLKREILIYYRQHNRPVVTVEIPEQDITDGVIQLVVVEAKVGRFICKGNKWFSDKLIEGNMHLDQGDVIDSNELLNDVAWLNTNPFRRTDVVFSPGDTDGTTNIELITKDRFPLRVYAGVDNTGTLISGNNRFYGGFNWANAFGLDHRLSYQWTQSANINQYYSHTVNYIAPLPWHHTLTLWGGYSQFHANLSRVHVDFGQFKDDGRSWQASGRYEIPIGSLYKYSLKNVTLGFDFKNTNNNFFFESTVIFPIVFKECNIAQFMGGFDWGHETKKHKLIFDSEIYYSPGSMFRHQSKFDFEDLRPGSSPKYVYGKLSISDLWRLPHGWEVFQDYRFQLSTGALIPSEQFGIGGYNTVRGYPERIFNADNGFVGNWELHTKKWSIGHLFDNSKLRDELYLLAFLDYGFGRNYDIPHGTVKTDWLLGVGPGLRYNIGPYLQARVDWGVKLHRTNLNEGSWNKLHFGVIASY